ncbi:MAG: permease [Verrucomicrobiota bacterium]
MSCCCPQSEPDPDAADECCRPKRSVDYLLWISLTVVLTAYVGHFIGHDRMAEGSALKTFIHGVYELMNTMWWGLLAGIVAVGVMHQLPRDAVIKVIGRPGSVSGILRAMFGGLLLDLCNHGILLVGMKLYERGASLGQTFAFLIASPWNSFSLTLILVALIGLPFTLLFILASAVVALVTGVLVDKWLCLRPLPGKTECVESARSWREVGRMIRQAFTPVSQIIPVVFKDGLVEARTILRWIFFGVVLAAAIRALMDPASFQEWFGPSVAGLLLTLAAATVIEVCSEGSTPIGADLVTRAQAPGNGFVFLMAGAATDYTEIMALKETTRRWSAALLLPALTVPQVLWIGYWINRFHH